MSGVVAKFIYLPGGAAADASAGVASTCDGVPCVDGGAKPNAPTKGGGGELMNGLHDEPPVQMPPLEHGTPAMPSLTVGDDATDTSITCTRMETTTTDTGAASTERAHSVSVANGGSGDANAIAKRDRDDHASGNAGHGVVNAKATADANGTSDAVNNSGDTLMTPNANGGAAAAVAGSAALLPAAPVVVTVSTPISLVTPLQPQLADLAPCNAASRALAHKQWLPFTATAHPDIAACVVVRNVDEDLNRILRVAEQLLGERTMEPALRRDSCVLAEATRQLAQEDSATFALTHEACDTKQLFDDKRLESDARRVHAKLIAEINRGRQSLEEKAMEMAAMAAELDHERHTREQSATEHTLEANGLRVSLAREAQRSDALQRLTRTKDVQLHEKATRITGAEQQIERLRAEMQSKEIGFAELKHAAEKECRQQKAVLTTVQATLAATQQQYNDSQRVIESLTAEKLQLAEREKTLRARLATAEQQSRVQQQQPQQQQQQRAVPDAVLTAKLPALPATAVSHKRKAPDPWHELTEAELAIVMGDDEARPPANSQQVMSHFYNSPRANVLQPDRSPTLGGAQRVTSRQQYMRPQFPAKPPAAQPPLHVPPPALPIVKLFNSPKLGTAKQFQQQPHPIYPPASASFAAAPPPATKRYKFG